VLRVMRVMGADAAHLLDASLAPLRHVMKSPETLNSYGALVRGNVVIGVLDPCDSRISVWQTTRVLSFPTPEWRHSTPRAFAFDFSLHYYVCPSS
jgi:hypothetical protein